MDLLDKACYMIEKDSNAGLLFNKLYPMTTENNNYLKILKRGNSLLTVGSSADQILNAILLDYKKITCTDLCPFTKLYYEFKIASIKAFDYHTYLDIYSMDSKHKSLFPRKYQYRNLRKYLSDYTRFFFDYLYLHYSHQEIRKGLFQSSLVDRNLMKHLNVYLENEINYNRLKDKLSIPQVDFIEGDICSLSLNQRYETIILSNLFDYIQISDCLNNIDVLKRMKKILTSDGEMLVYYLYSLSRFKDLSRCPANNDRHYKFKRITFNKKIENGIIIYRK